MAKVRKHRAGLRCCYECGVNLKKYFRAELETDITEPLWRISQHIQRIISSENKHAIYITYPTHYQTTKSAHLWQSLDIAGVILTCLLSLVGWENVMLLSLMANIAL